MLPAIGLASYTVGVAIHMWTVSWLPGVQWRGTGGPGLGAITVGPSGAGYGQGADAWWGPYAAGRGLLRVKLCGGHARSRRVGYGVGESQRAASRQGILLIAFAANKQRRRSYSNANCHNGHQP